MQKTLDDFHRHVVSVGYEATLRPKRVGEEFWLPEWDAELANPQRAVSDRFREMLASVGIKRNKMQFTTLVVDLRQRQATIWGFPVNLSVPFDYRDWTQDQHLLFLSAFHKAPEKMKIGCLYWPAGLFAFSQVNSLLFLLTCNEF